MKLLSTFLYVVALACTSSLAKTEECCLCDDCEDVAESKVDMLTLSPFREEEGTTCGEMALELLDVEEGSETCLAVRADYQTACCTAEFDLTDDVSTEKSYLRAARDLWTVSNANSQNNGNRGRSYSYARPASNNVQYNTQGGGFSCDICQGDAIKQLEACVVHDPQRGKTVQGMCPNIMAQFKNGQFANSMCNISRIRLKPNCCPKGGSSYNRGYSAGGWRAVGN